LRAFVAGATGYTGRELVRVLRARGAGATAHVRPDSPRLAEWQDRFHALGAEPDATPWQPDALRATLERVRPTHVFALLGTTRARARAAGTTAADAYEAIDYGLTALLLAATRATAPDARFIYLSAAGASERGNAYLRVRGRLERELRASGLSWISARPAFVTGADREESRPAERAAAFAIDVALAAARRIGLGSLAGRWRSLTGAQLAAALAILAESAPDGVYDAAALRAAVPSPSTRAG
jgi:nucleoside-diphosphate-sugar epimerase